jgi:hypothetical protein
MNPTKPKGEVQTETGDMLKGPKPLDRAKNTEERSTDFSGEDRTPDQPIGQIAHAGGQKKTNTEGGAGQPQTSRLDPEKQGGIGGP